MSANLKNKTISGLFWKSINTFALQGTGFVVGIILARLLSPQEFGLIGMVIIFTAISETFIDSGFKSALIRKKDSTQADYSTVFYYNLFMALIFYLILFISAEAISRFFDEPELKWIVRVIGLQSIIRALAIIQIVKVIKRLDFRLFAKIGILSSVFSGAVAIAMAYNGFGVWSLVIRDISGALLGSVFFWYWNRWMPSLTFSIQSFKELFGFGSKLLASALLSSVFENIYKVIIGKYFSAQQLGFYTRAELFRNLPSKKITRIMSGVTYPVLAQMQDDKTMLKNGYKKMIKSLMFLSLILLTGMAAIAEPMVLTLIGEQWRQSIVYLQLLCFPGALYPLHALNLNMLKVQGRSDLFLWLEIIKKLIAIPTIIIGIIWGIKVMILGMWVNTLIAYYLNSYYSGRHINYPMREQVADILPSLLLALFMGAILFITGWLMPFDNLPKLILQILIGGIISIGLSELLKLEAYFYIKQIILGKLTSIYHARRK